MQNTTDTTIPVAPHDLWVALHVCLQCHNGVVRSAHQRALAKFLWSWNRQKDSQYSAVKITLNQDLWEGDSANNYELRDLELTASVFI